MTTRKISDTTLALIHDLRDQGLKHGEIAEALGLPFRVVGAVIRGAWHPPAESRHRGPFLRCSGCGGKTQRPCMVCELRGRTNHMNATGLTAHDSDRRGLHDAEPQGLATPGFLGQRTGRGR